MIVRRLRLACVLVAMGLACAPPSWASPWNFLGSRQQAMGGAGVADTRDSTATYWNPANLAFQKGWGVNLPVTLQGSIENDALTKLSDLLVGFDVLDANAKSVFTCQPTCPGVGLGPEQIDRVANLLTQFADYGKQGESVLVGASLGLAGRYENFGFSALSITTGSVFPNTDLTNLGLGAAVLDLLSTCATTPADCRVPANVALGNQVSTLSSGGGTPLSPAQGGHLVYLLEQSGANSFDPDVQTVALGLVDPNSGLLSANNTGALTAGLSTQEFGFSWALKLPVPFMRKTRGTTRRILDTWVHQKIAVSVTPKYMLGVTFVKFFRYDDSENAGGIVTGMIDIDGSSVSSQFGLDIGVAYHPTPWLRVGLMARNVNTPSFTVQAFTGPAGRLVTSIDADPQVRMGMALIPIQRLTLAFDFDATENRVETIPGVASRYVSLGAEYVIPFHRHVDLALRLGGYSNVSDTVEDDWALSGGFGLRFGSFHLDLSAAGSFADEVIRTGNTTYENFPTRLQAGLGLSWEKSL